MPAVEGVLTVQAGSYEPQYWVVTNPETGALVDLTVPGYEVTGVVAAEPDNAARILAELEDGVAFRRTANGRVYFEPSSALSSEWTFTYGYYQVELTHPSGQTVRLAQGRFLVDPELVVTP